MNERLAVIFCLVCSLLLPWLLQGCVSVVDATTTKPVTVAPGESAPAKAMDDRLIETAAAVNIRKASAELRAAHINVACDDGIILLAGQVATAADSELAAETARLVNGVREVHNELIVAEPISLAARSSDTWLTTRIKSSFLLNKELGSGHITVVTENGIVFLMGRVTHAQADGASGIASSTSGVQKVVRIFEYTD